MRGLRGHVPLTDSDDANGRGSSSVSSRVDGRGDEDGDIAGVAHKYW